MMFLRSAVGLGSTRSAFAHRLSSQPLHAIADGSCIILILTLSALFPQARSEWTCAVLVLDKPIPDATSRQACKRHQALQNRHQNHAMVRGLLRIDPDQSILEDVGIERRIY